MSIFLSIAIEGSNLHVRQELGIFHPNFDKHFIGKGLNYG
ncbi:hypothetical protein MTBPR1_60046 [Candidatus Terasakiella magnetica]|uniref:Uncharacterized protein n=1 Tax=Candidatus Terasakiella magnetica TaxID=1867952 RepID=A0A1C3RJY1_9PROT|nr:hypothetical protein MTBPR1_60046 [Candidatus Terasakiella magnetica]